jgi:hypothetical protein
VLAVAIVAATLGGKDALAQDFPNRPIRIIVPYAAGGGSDITTRIVQGKAMELVGQSLLVDNRARGGTLIGTRMNQFPVGNTPEEFAMFLQDNMTRLVKVVRESNIKLD